MTEIYFFGIKTFITGQEEIKSKDKVTISQDDLEKSDN